MVESPLSSRTRREQESFNQGVQRDGYMRVVEHTCYLFLQRRNQIIHDELQYAQGKNALELGSISWKSWIEGNSIEPKNLYCINISQEEINQGEENARSSKVKPHFRLRDAHTVDFDDETFTISCALEGLPLPCSDGPGLKPTLPTQCML